MKKFFIIFFVTLGVVFFCLLLALAYFWIVDPYNIKPYIYNTNSTEVENRRLIDTSTETTAEAEGGLTEGQKNALQLVGIDPAVLPEDLTPEQEQCFVREFGQARVDEIKAGSNPTPLEVLTGKNCL